MPFYDYRCSDCGECFSMLHSMSESCNECAFCLSSNVIKVVAEIGSKVDNNKFQNKVGDLVKSHIEEAREAVAEQKKDMKREYK